MKLSKLIEKVNDIYYNNTSNALMYQIKAKELLAIVGDINIKLINSDKVQGYIKALQKKNNKPATINNKLSYLSKLLKYAAANKLIDMMPVINYQKVINQKETYIDRNTLAQLIRRARKKNYKELSKMLLIGYYTGLRINNIISLTDDNIKDNVLSIYDRKTNRNFELPISNHLKIILRYHKQFTSNYNVISKQFTRIRQDDSITIHSLRHTFCSNLVRKDIPVNIIQKLANHSSLQTTLRYTHISTKQLEDAIKVL